MFRRALLAGREEALFCTDLDPTNASLFVGFSADGGYVFEQWVIPRDQLWIVGSELRFHEALKPAREAGASSWSVGRDAIEGFLSAAEAG